MLRLCIQRLCMLRDSQTDIFSDVSTVCTVVVAKQQAMLLIQPLDKELIPFCVAKIFRQVQTWQMSPFQQRENDFVL